MVGHNGRGLSPQRARFAFQELIRVLPGWVWKGGPDPLVSVHGELVHVDVVLLSCRFLLDRMPKGVCETLGLELGTCYAEGSVAAEVLVVFARRLKNRSEDVEPVDRSLAYDWEAAQWA